ncbi:SDR family oxidoreductase [Curtobacterium pusillum]|uniref:NAD-dependent epimerase/dehydratase family protein n=1 Tax=Curtobacterium pusillum TaxID=69373 RepID=A0ABX2MBM3_9MICO|nr:NAD-dependent epimerase/dehydratase family protein [Curtobacterium pusillum]NUU15069.1 NAD-dependent epimerase/dehydratase family protein [Curtobacterium pusillum]GLK32633.1 hypothetical protein GCM10017610_29180 [Curtobacterium pusillum]
MSGPSVLFIGGSGVISAACVREAVEQGVDVTVLNRGTTGGRPIPESVTRLQADVSDRSALADVLGDRRFDVVVNWIAFTPDQVQADVEFFAGRTRQYVFISSASAYQTPATHLPITESTPLKNPYWQYSRDKIACEELLMTAYREQDFPVTIVRPSHTYDETKLPLTGGWTAVGRMRAGKPIIITGDGSSLWTITHSRDFAVGFTGLLDRAEAIGEAFTITSDEAPTWNAIAQEIAAAAGVEDLQIVHVPADAIAAVDADWGAALLGDKANSSVFDNSKVRSLVPWYRARTPYRQGVREVIAWYESHPEAQVVDERLDALMDELAERWQV